MSVGLFVACLIILLAAYSWILNTLKPRVVRMGLIGAAGLWIAGWVMAVVVAGLPTVFVDQEDWAFLAGLVPAGAINTWIYGRLAWEIGRSRKLASQGRGDGR